jgi:hypothetical protein
MENDLERLVKEREELEDRCMKLIDEKRMADHNYLIVCKERDQHKKRLADFQEAMWSVMGDRIMDEIVCSGFFKNLVSEAVDDYDITDNDYFERAVLEVINNYDFDETLYENLSDRVAQVIADGEFIFR